MLASGHFRTRPRPISLSSHAHLADQSHGAESACPRTRETRSRRAAGRRAGSRRRPGAGSRAPQLRAPFAGTWPALGAGGWHSRHVSPFGRRRGKVGSRRAGSRLRRLHIQNPIGDFPLEPNRRHIRRLSRAPQRQTLRRSALRAAPKGGARLEPTRAYLDRASVASLTPVTAAGSRRRQIEPAGEPAQRGRLAAPLVAFLVIVPRPAAFANSLRLAE